MVSAFAVTSAVSAAKQAGQSDIRQYDLTFGEPGDLYGTVYGKLTIDAKTGHFVYTANPTKISQEEKSDWKVKAGLTRPIAVVSTNSPLPTPSWIGFGSTTVTDGGTVHGEGYIDDFPVYSSDGSTSTWTTKDVVAWLDANSDSSWFGFIIFV